MKAILKLALILILSLFINISSQTVRYVYFNASGSGGLSWANAHTTIQEAVDAASSGDEILVGYGSDPQIYTYSISSNIEINNKNVKITSASYGNDNSYATAQYDYTKVAISATGTNRLFYIHGNGVTNATVIRGFKLTNGNASNHNNMGGAVYCGGEADPTITYCWITGNTAESAVFDGHGGGIAAEDVSPVITNNLIENNVARSGPDFSAGKGGGVWVQGGSATISNNTIRDNIGRESENGYGYGGGIGLYNTSTTISGNTISNNIAGSNTTDHTGYGGGISITGYGGHTISDNTIENNIANTGPGEGHGGGLYIDGGSGAVNVTNNILYNNTASTNAATGTINHYGGGMYSVRSATVKFNIFNHNTVLLNSDDNSNNAYGGGLFLSLGTIENNTFYANADVSFLNTGGKGSGYYCHYAPTSFKNNLFVNHATSVRANSDGKAIATSDQGQFTVNDCGFHNNDTDIGNDALPGTNVSGNPQFTDAGNNNFTLQYNSPYVDAGNGDYAYNETTNHDYGWKYDIGAEEYSGSRAMQNVSGTGEILFGGKVRAKINVTTPGTLTALDLTVHENANHANAPTSVKRWISISPTGSGYTCNVTLSYKDSELNGETEANLKMYRWNGSSWEGPKAPSSTSTDNNWLVCNGETSFSDWILDADGALPVELTSFFANVQDGKVLLNWQTATEVDNYGFEVERSVAKIICLSNDPAYLEGEGFETIGFIEGHGNSNSPKEYSFLDESTSSLSLSKCQYRLKQIDTDGSFTYSETIEIEIDLPTKFELSQNYPNPFNPTTTIKYNIPLLRGDDVSRSDNIRGVSVTLKIYNILGAEVATLINQKQQPGNYKVEFNASQLTSGIYIYRLVSGRFVDSKKLLLLK